MSAPDPWAGLLDEGERILWQGRPDAGFRLDLDRPIMLIMGVMFMAFSVYWMQTAAEMGGYFWMFGLIFFAIGFQSAIGVHFWKTYLRARTHYTLTDRRGFIATEVLGRKKLVSYPLRPDGESGLIDGPLATVVFSSATRQGKNGAYRVPIAFEDIPDGREVYRLVRDAAEALA